MDHGTDIIDMDFVDNNYISKFEWLTLTNANKKLKILNNQSFRNNIVLSNLHAKLIVCQSDFDLYLYKIFCKKILKLQKIDDTTVIDLLKHYITFKKQGDKINFHKLDQLFKINSDFDIDIYRIHNSELSNYNIAKLIEHYVDHGVYECRKSNIRDVRLIDNKDMFRRICSGLITKIDKYKIPRIPLKSEYETVLIEFRILPHIEFLLRNTILLLDENWSHTIICGNTNYDFILSICSSISTHINIIKLGRDNLNREEYSDLLTTTQFWEMFYGEKLLIYQEDSMLFKGNIDDFLSYDYIGAPWPRRFNYTTSGAGGNGGFSLRSKRVMIEIIDKISVFDTGAANNNDKKLLEDIYFCKNMENLNVGKLAPHEVAGQFSSELIHNENSLGGHNMWLSDPNWANRIPSVFKNITRFTNYALIYICHNQQSFELIYDYLKYPNCYVIKVGYTDLINVYGYEHKIIIAKDLPDNIEHEDKLLTFTAWYAIIKNKLFTDYNHLCLFEYDVILKDYTLYNIDQLIKQSSNQVDAISFISGDNAFTMDCNISHLFDFLKQKNIEEYDTNSIWYHSTNHCIRREVLAEFVGWYYPDCLYFKNKDLKKFSYYHERLFSVYIKHFNKKHVLLNEPFIHTQRRSHVNTSNHDSKCDNSM